MVESKGKFVYVANQGTTQPEITRIAALPGTFLTTSPSYQLSFISDEPFGSGSGPQCIVEDPSDQFIYEANEYDSTVTGRVLDPTRASSIFARTGTYTLEGPPTWCLMDGRTN